jgi:hypothetical protein
VKAKRAEKGQTVTSTVKQQAKSLIDELPETADWDDVLYAMYVQLEEISMTTSLRTLATWPAV